MLRRLIPVLLVAATVLPVPARAMHPGIFLSIAHRGGAALAPENTLAAFRNADAIFDAHPHADGWIELDTQLTKDGKLVVIHDDTLDRTTDCSGAVIEKTYQEMASCDAGGGERVPLLSEVFAEGVASGWKLVVEIKNIPGEANFDPPGRAAAEAFVAAARGYPRDALIVQSFWPPSLDQVKLLDPAMQTLFLTTSDVSNGIGFNLRQNAVFATARGHEYSSPNFDAGDVDRDGVAFAHSLGRKVIVWTVNDAASVARMRAAGVDGIMSDDPNLVLP